MLVKKAPTPTTELMLRFRRGGIVRDLRTPRINTFGVRRGKYLRKYVRTYLRKFIWGRTGDPSPQHIFLGLKNVGVALVKEQPHLVADIIKLPKPGSRLDGRTGNLG